MPRVAAVHGPIHVRGCSPGKRNGDDGAAEEERRRGKHTGNERGTRHGAESIKGARGRRLMADGLRGGRLTRLTAYGLRLTADG
jgi:hypothetical protein